MRTQTLCLAILALVGCAYAETFSSVQQAVADLPELSMLNKNTDAIALADKLRDPNFVGTLFAPTDAALQPLEEAVGGDLTSLLGDPDQVNDVFSTAVIPGKVLTLADLKDGMKLTTLNGNQVTVKVAQTAKGPAYFINKARITDGNIVAGKAIIHEMNSIVVPQEYQDMLDALVPADESVVATSDKSGDAAAVDASTASSPAKASTTATTATTTTTTSSTAGDSSDATTARILATNSTGSSTKTNSAGSAGVGAALLAVPALLAMLL